MNMKRVALPITLGALLIAHRHYRRCAVVGFAKHP